MAGRCLHPSELQNCDRSLTMVLTSALLEWMLILMLLVYGLFGYLITKLARYCKLPLPCLLCSRIDHSLGSENVGFYWDMICGNHKLEISTLVYCHFHEKLVDVRGMCESCLFSFATKNKSNAETYRLLVGKLGGEDLSGFDGEPVTNDHKTKGLDMKHCSCCNELFMSRRHVRTLFQTKSTGFDDTELDLPLSRELSQDHYDLNKEIKSLNPSAGIGREYGNSLVQFGYSELKINSDTESDIQMSDAEDARSLISNDPLRDLLLESKPMKSFIAVSEDESVYDTDQHILSPEPSETLHLVQADIMDLHDGPSVVPASGVGHGLEELNWQEIDINLDSSASTSLMTCNDVSESPNDGNISYFSSIEKSNIKEVENLPVKSDIRDSKALDIKTTETVLDKMAVKDSKNLDIKEGGIVTEKVDAKDSKDLDVKEDGAVQTLVRTTEKSQELESVQANTDLNNMKIKSQQKDKGLQLQIPPNYLDLSDAYKLAINGKSRQLSGKLAEQLAGKESPNVDSDLKLLLSHLSRGSEFLSSDILSPGLAKKLDEMKANDSSTSVGMKILQKRISLERNDSKNSLDRNESGIESLDFISVSEIEGESEIDRLRRQLEHNRKFLITLLKDLEEERNASEIAANETMAMITRLQEEKAALQMEASHDLRMMEEQAEYDLEALDKLNEHVMEKEKEIQDLEAELEYYRSKYQNESNLENDGDSVSNVCLSGSEKFIGIPDNLNGLVEDTKSISKCPLLAIENERKHISECLKNLEKKLSAFRYNRIYPDLKDFDRSVEHGKDSYDSKLSEEGQQVNGESDENDALSDKVGLVSTGSHKALLRRVYSFKRSKSAGAEQRTLLLKEADIVALVNEVSSLSKRLQALEADQSFVELSIKTLQNGEEGLIQEIASHLKELRKIGIRRHDKNNPVKRLVLYRQSYYLVSL
ncbi:Myosin-binding protein 1 [Bienertia sinuspersici]